MMNWLQSIDLAVFRFINGSLSNPVFGTPESEGIMPFLSWNSAFIPAVVLVAVWLFWKGGVRGRLFVFSVLATIAIGDGFICNSLKDGIGRLRPFNDVADAIVLVGKGGSGSMPSSHTANWFSAMTVAFLFYRRSWRFMLPMALLIGFSRVYLGVHYPSDVLVGALLGVTYATVIVLGIDRLWNWLGRKWFPVWHERLPNIVPRPLPFSDPVAEESSVISVPNATVTDQWIRLGYLLIIVVLFARWGYLGAGKIELSEDEAYQWVWSNHLAFSYYSKPPFIAYTQFLGTSLWGDTEFGVRFFSPLIAAILSLLVFRFLLRETNLRVAFAALVMPLAVPLLAVGSILMTIDPLNVLFWTASMITGWQAVQKNCNRAWAWTGLWIGCGFLSKYTTPLNVLCWATFFALWKPARSHLRRRGPWLALGISLICTLPVLIWNAQHDWITFTHLGERGGLDNAWQFKPNFIWDFALAEIGLLNPIFFLAAVWASIAFWKRRRGDEFMVFLFSMGAPLFLFFFLYTIKSRVQPNWIAPSVIPLFMLSAVYWERRFREGNLGVRKWFVAGLLLGIVPTLLLHDTNLVQKATGNYLPAKVDPLRRVRAWRETAAVVNEARAKLLEEGKPVFIIGGHYGVTGEMAFYLPDMIQDQPQGELVYYQTADEPKNQFYFWPGYTNRLGENAIYLRRVKIAEPAPEKLVDEFETVTDLGLFTIQYRGRDFRTLQLFECRNLLPPKTPKAEPETP